MRMCRRTSLWVLFFVLLLAPSCGGSSSDEVVVDLPDGSVARQWNELLLRAIRNDFARPTVHARNLLHTSIAMWDAWAAFDATAQGVLVGEAATAPDVEAARHEAMSYAVYRVLAARFQTSPGAAESLPLFDAQMARYGYAQGDTNQVGNTPSALGNRIGAAVLAFGASDGANEANNYANQFYDPVNPDMFPADPGNPNIVDPDRWQPLVLDFTVDQAGNMISNIVPFLGPEWGQCAPFALSAADLTINTRGGFDYWVYHDPGPPPAIADVDRAYQVGFEQVLEWSSLLDPASGTLIDISPASRGNNTLGTNDGSGRVLNPATGFPYPAQLVPEGDYYRVLAEFWADGPESETPPGHWFVIANYVSDNPALVKQLQGAGAVLGDLEWDVKLYLALAGAVHDSAVTAWGIKGWYDYIRPVSALRHMGDLGQRTNLAAANYDPDGVELVLGRVEEVTLATIGSGQRHEHLAGPGNANVGKIAVRAWRGPDVITDPNTDTAGVGWILLENWWPYQRPSFVTPPFAGYVSGHSTFSRAAATVLTMFTGSEYFPGGVGVFEAPRNEFLVFEEGPSVDVTLQWATYFDASDECSLSRIYGGIHPPADDVPGRIAGAAIGADAFALALDHFGP